MLVQKHGKKLKNWQTVKVYKMTLDYIEERITDKGYPVLNNAEYEYVVNKYTIGEIIDTTACIIMRNRKKKLPFREIGEEEVAKKLKSLQEKDSKIITDYDNVWTKHQYDFETGPYLGTIQLGHSHNSVSDYFHRDQRYRVGGYNRLSPYDIWNGGEMTDAEWKKKLLQFLSPLFRSVNNYRKIEESEYMFCFRLSSVCYTATQFKPSVAKTIYEKFSTNGNVIDFSMGWGDRLAGFYASSNTRSYLGTDPNVNLFSGYENQRRLYSSLVSGKKSFAVCSPSEEYAWKSNKQEYDLVFTSPPYFSTELYGKGIDGEYNQSWKKYPNAEDWLEKFLFKTIENINEIVIENGIFALNIFDVETKKGNRFEICEKLNRFMKKEMKFNYLGYVGMRMKQRPKTFGENKDAYMASYYVEPIWIFQK